MKKASLLCVMLLALTATIASAAGLNLRWQNCYGTNPATQNRNFACNSNTAPANLLEGSFVLPRDVPQVSAAEIVVDLASASPTLPDWWQFKNIGVCRATSLTIAAHDEAACPDWALGLASMNIAAYQLGKYGPNSARILCVNAVDPTALQDLFIDVEYASFQLSINNAKTVGTPSCAGCLVPVCIVFNSCNMTTAGNLNNTLVVGSTDAAHTSNYATWQGGAGVSSPLGQGCPQATPTKNATWGSVKSLYR